MIIPQTHSPRKETEIEIETVTETELKLKLMQQMKQTSLTYKWTVEKWSEAAKRGNGVDRQYADKSPNNTHTERAGMRRVVENIWARVVTKHEIARKKKNIFIKFD